MRKITDKQRLDWLQDNKPARVEYRSAWGYFIVTDNVWHTHDAKPKIRQAIDAAMRAAKRGGGK